jgi:AraC family transcriptional regulator
MSALVILPAGAASSVKGPAQSIVRITPPDIARRHVTTLDAIQVDAVEVIRREPYEYGFKSSCHMLIMSEHQERDDGETLLEGLPKSTLREFSRKLSFVPAGHRFFGWQKPRVLARVTYFLPRSARTGRRS